MTFLSPLLLVAMSLLIGYLASMNKNELKNIGIYDESGLFKDEFKNSESIAYHDLSMLPLATAKDSVAKESYEGLLYIPKSADTKVLEKQIQYISNDDPSLNFIGDLEDVIDNKLTKINFENTNISYELVDKNKAKSSISLQNINGEKSFKGVNIMKIAIGGFLGYLIMMFIIIYGNMVMRSVIEEKTNRIIEIIISSVKPYQLMMGKIIGTSMAGILQFLIWVILGGGLLFGLSLFLNVQPGQASSIPPEMAHGIAADAQVYLQEFLKLPLFSIFFGFLVFFIGGYYLYSSLYAAIGAAVDSETDSQQFLLPIIMPLMLGVYIGFFTVIDNPHGTVATVFSMIPLTSPIVMIMRIPFGVPWWQLLISVVLLFGTFFLIVWFAAKIYRVGILMYGKKPTYKEIFKWLKY